IIFIPKRLRCFMDAVNKEEAHRSGDVHCDACGIDELCGVEERRHQQQEAGERNKGGYQRSEASIYCKVVIRKQEEKRIDTVVPYVLANAVRALSVRRHI
ncbi:MAG: hypothetical protein WCD75_19245, partial [Rhodoplanes sp.]